ncbi:hypothetical protein LQZ19_15295 [Treponema primitia]|uniref:hypothetical protein n=1 Tax=Treponema primitia TaxID=88058 RepID=UPI0039818726
MKHRKRIFLALLLLAGLVSVSAFADIGLSIRYFDKRIYYLQDDPILVQITVTNSSPSSYRFRLADDRAFSIDFDIRTMTNLTVDPADILIRRRSTSQQVFFRDISVESGESFSFVEDLRNYASLTRSGSYVVQVRMYPELYRNTINTPVAMNSNGVPLESNRLSLNIRPPALPGPGGVPLALDVETNANLVREKLPPDQVVNYILSARQKGQWEKFFLYLDLETMLIRNAPRQRQWLAESEEGRRRMLARYRSELESEVTDGDIATIPMEFQIERTTYSAEEGTVSVLEKFKTGNYIERKRYTYYLRQKDDVWTIVDYTVLNLGTE